MNRLKKLLYYFSVIHTQENATQTFLNTLSMNIYDCNKNFQSSEELKNEIKTEIIHIINSYQLNSITFQPKDVIENLGINTANMKITAKFRNFQITEIKIDEKVIFNINVA